MQNGHRDRGLPVGSGPEHVLSYRRVIGRSSEYDTSGTACREARPSAVTARR